ncbi:MULTISPECIES: hypothetical protein [Nocardia]|uniref:Uncharacterized protein n=1 Tax=Nocardia implantans TaxID=3108168 RepID=A0ABU6B516_9NOCA|nr:MULTISPECIES: hypothetical protein [unclassified Nocardia]MBF6196308.1 hypothetical protein [Nocardia beijingensis]MEA3533066.1 hypothetical protein [Nocardia sp. CDC192]MEB3514877.1 hypothetical protein [Nocardia sp. CDC186]
MSDAEEDWIGRLPELTDRATRAGYRMMRDPVSPHDWKLLDAEHGDVIVCAASLAQIEQWLDS